MKQLSKTSPLLFAVSLMLLLFSCGNLENDLINGKMAPDLNIPDTKGDSISLSSLRGKIVLVDFWASWCVPCRKVNPKIVAIYNKYKDADFEKAEGFTVYSVSLDAEKKPWLDAIEKDGLRWPSHVSELNGWKAEAANIYSLQAIPASYLLDENGMIIGKDLRHQDLDKILSLRLAKTQ